MQRAMTHGASWIDPDGVEHGIDEFDDHLDMAGVLIDVEGISAEEGVDDPILQLLERGWIRRRGNSFEVYKNPTRNQKDIIFMLAKEHGFNQIWVDGTFGGVGTIPKQIVHGDSPEALYESQKLTDLILNEFVIPPYRGVKHEKPIGRLEKAKSALPFMDRVKIKIDKNGIDDAHHWPRSNEIIVSEKLVTRYWILSTNIEMWIDKYPQRYWNTISESSNRYGLGENQIEYGYEYLLNTLAHELGHCVYDWLIEKEETRKQVKSKLGKTKLMTQTVGAYSRYVAQQQEEREESGGFISRALTDKVSHERFAEMFRLYVIQGKYSSFFDKILKGI